MRGRYIYNKYTNIDTSAQLPVFYTNLQSPYTLVTLAEYHNFSPNITNEFRVGYNRSGYNYTVPSFKFPGQDAFPNLTIDEFNYLNVGPDPNAPQYSQTNTYSAVDNVSWVHGAHSFKFGAQYSKWISPQLFIQRSRGDYEWGTLSDFVNDVLPEFAERSFGSVGYDGNESAIYAWQRCLEDQAEPVVEHRSPLRVDRRSLRLDADEPEQHRQRSWIDHLRRAAGAEDRLHAAPGLCLDPEE